MRTGIQGKGWGPPVWVEVLGPLRLVVGDGAVEVPGPKRRALLALLARADGRAVPVQELFDALWPEGLPESARATLQSHVSRLRGHLGLAAARLEGLSGAYRLALDKGGGGTDVARARSLLDAANVAEPADARHLLGEARSLWRGEPLAEFADVAPLAAWAVSLDELRRAVGEAHAAAALVAGATTEAVDLASRLVGDTPLSETAVVQLMRALDASGRAADALRSGYDYRRRLSVETGLEPSPALAELEREIAGGTSGRAGEVRRPAGRLRGRDSELAALHRLLSQERLVTVLGPGGVGKTRLATEIAARSEQVTALLLTPVTDATALPHALAAALDLGVLHGDILPACAALLAAGPHLLLVDNCEHLLPGVRDVVAMLLDECPELTVLATSREPLGLPAEQRLRIAPLPLAVPDTWEDLARSPAVAVFVDRARHVRADFDLRKEDLQIVGQIVRQLDGIPLAIELAAGRISSLGLADIGARLDRSLDLLSDGRDVTLRQTVAWSYDLLPDDERRLFRHLGVFPDGFDLATAETVATDLDLAGDAAGAVAHLVDASMIDVVLGGDTRYRMLDTMRAFAHDRLEAESEYDAATERFLQWALALVTWVDWTIDTAEEAHADRVLRRELVNLRAAWRLVREQERLNDAVRIVLGITVAAGWRDLTEAWGWMLELADDPAVEAHPDASSVLGVAAESAWARGELDRADRLARRGLALTGEGAWSCQSALALVALSRGDLPSAVARATEAAAQATRTDGIIGVAALAAAYDGDLARAAGLNEGWVDTIAAPSRRGFHAYVAGEIDALAGRVARAEEHYERAITLAHDSGATFVQGIAAVGLVRICAETGRVAEALDGYRNLVDYWERTGGWLQEWTTLRNLARLLRVLGDEETALFLHLAADGAPDAPPATDNDGWHEPGPSTGKRSSIQAQAARRSRAQVLDVARRAIDRHRPGFDRRPPIHRLG